jgi:hypothetical protein
MNALRHGRRVAPGAGFVNQLASFCYYWDIVKLIIIGSDLHGSR